MTSPADPLRDAVARHLRDWLHQHPGNMESLACQLGVSVSSVSMWAAGTRFPGSAHLSALAAALGIPPCRFLCPGPGQNPACPAAGCPDWDQAGLHP